MADSNGSSATTTNEVEREPREAKKGKRRGARKRGKQPGTTTRGGAGRVAFPKDSLAKCLRIPQGILDQNAGNECTDREAASFAKIGWTGLIGVEISSAIKYGLLERPAPRKSEADRSRRQDNSPSAGEGSG